MQKSVVVLEPWDTTLGVFWHSFLSWSMMRSWRGLQTVGCKCSVTALLLSLSSLLQHFLYQQLSFTLLFLSTMRYFSLIVRLQNMKLLSYNCIWNVSVFLWYTWLLYTSCKYICTNLWWFKMTSKSIYSLFLSTDS